MNRDSPPTPDEVSALREWANRSQVHRKELERAQAFWSDADLLQAMAVPIERVGTGRPRRRAICSWARLPRLSKPLALAATLLLGVAIALSIQLGSLERGLENGVYATAIGELETVTLPDQSRIQMDTDSQIRVAYSDSHRRIFLDRGKAYFDVAKNAERPFEVYAGEGMVEAVGTAFSISVISDELEIVVDNGKVNLYQVEPTAHLAPGPDEQSTKGSGDAFHPDESTSTKVLAVLEQGQSALMGDSQVRALSAEELAEALSWRRGVLVFKNDPLGKVISEISRYTAVDIRVIDPALNELEIGGRFKAGQLEAFLDVLQTGFGIQVSQVDANSIELRSRGI
jgi:transmembrane sensor